MLEELLRSINNLFTEEFEKAFEIKDENNKNLELNENQNGVN